MSHADWICRSSEYMIGREARVHQRVDLELLGLGVRGSALSSQPSRLCSILAYCEITSLTFMEILR